MVLRLVRMIGSLSVLIEAEVEQVLFRRVTLPMRLLDIAEWGLCVSWRLRAARAAEVMEPTISSSSSDSWPMLTSSSPSLLTTSFSSLMVQCYLWKHTRGATGDEEKERRKVFLSQFLFYVFCLHSQSYFVLCSQQFSAKNARWSQLPVVIIASTYWRCGHTFHAKSTRK